MCCFCAIHQYSMAFGALSRSLCFGICISVKMHWPDLKAFKILIQTRGKESKRGRRGQMMRITKDIELRKFATNFRFSLSVHAILFVRCCCCCSFFAHTFLCMYCIYLYDQGKECIPLSISVFLVWNIGELASVCFNIDAMLVSQPKHTHQCSAVSSFRLSEICQRVQQL